AALVVVGNRGHGPVTGPLLGSVAYSVATHAHCPVVVVRGESEEGLETEAPVVSWAWTARRVRRKPCSSPHGTPWRPDRRSKW
ncbi:MAG TPA: universal stress protein, partial [Actinomycetales bacterium]|nr:universal stress protein [Actinomycetales bacterium]